MRTIAAAILPPALLLTGCSGQGFVDFTEWAGSSAESWSYKHANDPAIAFDVAGPLAIDVESFGGSVKVLADEKHERAVVTVTRRAEQGYMRTEEAEASLEEIEWTANIVGGELGQVLQVRAGTADVEPYFQSVDIKIELPEVDGLRVHTREGDVIAINIAGAVDIVTSDGRVRVMTPRPMTRSVTIINNRGDIDYRIRAESTARLDCEAIRGSVHSQVRFGRLTVVEGDHDTLRATLNDGSNPVVLRSADGHIRVAVVAAPTMVGDIIVD